MAPRLPSPAPGRVQLGLVHLVAPLVAAAAAACTLVEPKGDPPGGPGGTGATGPGDAGPGGAGGAGGEDEFDAGLPPTLQIAPKNPVLVVDLPVGNQGVQFTCTDTATGMPVAASFTIATPELGAIDGAGHFKPVGNRAGTVLVRCQLGAASAETTLKVALHDIDDPDGIPQAQKDILRGPPGGEVDKGFRYLYPYDRTVFPRGVVAPEVHVEQGAQSAQAYYLQIVAPDIEYEGFLKPSAAPRFAIPQEIWDALERAVAGDKLELRAAKLANGKKYGPLQRTLLVAKGGLHGTIYYNTYDSPLAGTTGAVMRIKGNSSTPEVLLGNCTVCHSVSADGSTLAAANNNKPGGGGGGVYDLSGGVPQPVWVTPEGAAFAAVYPKNGEVLVTTGVPPSGLSIPGLGAPGPSALRTKNGTVIPNSGIESHYAQAGVFSPDGAHLAFTDRSVSEPYGTVLALLDYDAAAQRFSKYEVLGVPPQGRHYSWPAFTPDGRFVLYQDGTGDDLATWNGNEGRIVAIDLQSGARTHLPRLNGDAYAPAGGRDLDKSYEPTIAPVASGGYFWVMFTSRRTYGNRLDGGPEVTKRLWVSALSIDPQPLEDFSHPPFYLGGQELQSGNSRGFWALDPCKAEGTSCASGDECCQGYCNPKGDGSYVCGPPDGSCSEEFESCETDADCCSADLRCIGGRCTSLPPK